MSKHPDELGDRMKGYEGVEAKRRLDATLPICARIDGRSFSRFTRGFDRPFDQRIGAAMRAACMRLVNETNALIGFVQSDEISLIWQADEGSQIFFDGKVQKMSSVLAAVATSEFTFAMLDSAPDVVRTRRPVFDARVWQVPSKEEAANVIVWRSQDARKNGISSACRAHLSAKQMHGLDQFGMLAAMAERGTDYHAVYDAGDRFGVFYQRVTKPTEIDDETWAAIPDKNKPESRMVLRSSVEKIPIHYFGNVSNRTAVIFDHAAPEFYDT